jgi:protein-S-isoprenylcysteine O-methyltransferase Ste14
LYGVVVYVFFLATFIYAIGFAGNIGVPRGIDSPATAPAMESLLIDLALLGLFAVQHSVMARKGFKAWWTRIVSPVVERSTFVLAPGEIAPAAGRITVLIGPNGGGKTTVLRAAAGMQLPEQGQPNQCLKKGREQGQRCQFYI